MELEHLEQDIINLQEVLDLALVDPQAPLVVEVHNPVVQAVLEVQEVLADFKDNQDNQDKLDNQEPLEVVTQHAS